MEEIRNYKIEGNDFFSAANRLNKACFEHIKEILNKCENNRISWTYDEIEEKGLDHVDVVYTEWKHCIDLTNIRSFVTGLRIGERGLIIIECEDGEMTVGNMNLPFENIADLYGICGFLDNYLETKKINE